MAKIGWGELGGGRGRNDQKRSGEQQANRSGGRGLQTVEHGSKGVGGLGGRDGEEKKDEEIWES